MKIKVLIDNISQSEMLCEWGLAIYIEYNGKKILLDTGTTGDFVKNADLLGIDVADIDFGVLSHAHYDHSDGMPSFFERNKKAVFYLRGGADENCYKSTDDGYEYIGIKKGILTAYADRICYAKDDFKLDEGIYLIPHKTEGLDKIGKEACMYVKSGENYEVEEFSHEQSLVFETEKGLVIFNSCSHGGADNIIREIEATFEGKRIYVIIGGFHLFRTDDDGVYKFAERLEDTGINKIYTGHCTGERAIEILKEKLGDRVQAFYSGFETEI